ncbi:MAG TPA: YhcH/YjgK/YiaL family protein [Mucilaginibacter sp.]
MILKNKHVYRLAIAVIAFITMGNTAIAQQKTKDAVNHAAAVKWFETGNWRNGLKLIPHASINPDEFYKQYHSNKAVWDKVLVFLKETNLDILSAGKHAIDGDNAYASVTEAPSKDFDKTAWESHEKYIDLQYVIKGKEQIDVADVSTATITRPYDAGRDAANYTAKGTSYFAAPGSFFLFFPQDAHRPNILVPGYEVVKKLVIKIKVAE